MIDMKSKHFPLSNPITLDYWESFFGTKPNPWPEGKKMALSLSFDDAGQAILPWGFHYWINMVSKPPFL